MDSNGWEYVGKKGSKAKASAKKKLALERVEPEGPIKLSETAFDAFIELEKRKEDKSKATVKTVEQTKEPIVSVKSKKKKPISPNDSPKTTKSTAKDFDTLARELKLADFEVVIEETKAHFPDSPLIWIKDIGYFLNEKLKSEPEDTIFTEKPIDYPLSALPANIRDFIVVNIRQCPESILQLIQEQFLLVVVNNMVKGNSPTMGFRIILQCISYDFPKFNETNIQKFIQYRTSYQNRPPICLTILWVAAQAGKTNLSVGLNVWFQLLFPVIQMRAYSKFVIDSLQILLELHSSAKITEEVLTVEQFFIIFDFLFSQNGLQPSLQKLFLFLYPKIKNISIGVNSSKNLRFYFPSFLNRIRSNMTPEQSQEVLSELCKCLSLDSQCFSVWRSLYSQNLFQSSVLLKHLAENYRALPSKLSKKLLRETVLSFRNTNEDTRAQERLLKEGQEDCEKYCEILLNTMSSWKLPIKYILMILCVIFITYLAYDTKVHGSLQNSQTGTFLKQTGALPVVEQAWNKIELYSTHGYRWVSKNAPIYWKSITSVIVPYLHLFWEKFAELMVYCWDSTEVIRKWANNNIPPILEKISDDYVPKVQSIVWQFWSQIQSHLSTVLTLIVNIALSTANWLQENVLTGSLSPENMKSIAIQAVESMQNYTTSAYHWISTQVNELRK